MALDFEYEELTEHYIGQLTKVAKNLSDEEYVEGHKGEKVRMYKEMTVMMNEVQTITSKCLLLQSGQTIIQNMLGNICCRYIPAKQLCQRQKWILYPHSSLYCFV